MSKLVFYIQFSPNICYLFSIWS